MLWASYARSTPASVAPGGGVLQLRQRWRRRSVAAVGERAARDAERAGALLSLGEAVDLAATQARE